MEHLHLGIIDDGLWNSHDALQCGMVRQAKLYSILCKFMVLVFKAEKLF